MTFEEIKEIFMKAPSGNVYSNEHRVDPSRKIRWIMWTSSYMDKARNSRLDMVFDERGDTLFCEGVEGELLSSGEFFNLLTKEEKKYFSFHLDLFNQGKIK